MISSEIGKQPRDLCYTLPLLAHRVSGVPFKECFTLHPLNGIINQTPSFLFKSYSAAPI